MENYEQKYKAALGWMQTLYKGLHGKTKEEAEQAFPELKEKDELEEELERYKKEQKIKYEEDINMLDFARHFANWQKRKHDKYLTEAYMDGVEKGKKQMTKQTITATKVGGGIAVNNKTGQPVPYSEYKVYILDEECEEKKEIKLAIIKE